MGTKCRNPKCSREAVTRGLCNTCYTVARELIKEGETTWAKLEAEEKISPKKYRPSTAREWLLDMKGKRIK